MSSCSHFSRLSLSEIPAQRVFTLRNYFVRLSQARTLRRHWRYGSELTGHKDAFGSLCASLEHFAHLFHEVTVTRPYVKRALLVGSLLREMLNYTTRMSAARLARMCVCAVRILSAATRE